MPEESLPIDDVRLCFEPKFLNDEKSFEDLLDGSTPPVVDVVASEAVLLTVNDGVGGTFGGEASDEDDEDNEDNEDSGGRLRTFSV